MTNANLSQNPNWSRVSRLRPQLREHVNMYPQVFRGERWYVLWDQSSHRHLRFSSAAYAFIGRLNGKLTVEEAWYKSIAGLKKVALSQDEVLLILTQLFAVDILKSDLPIEATHFFERFQRDKHIKRRNAFMNPLAIRVPLIDPNKFLNRYMPWLRPVFSKSVALVWLLTVSFATLLSMVNFPAIDASFNSDILSPGNVFSMLVVFVFIKTAHEFAHAFTVKMWGGDVHEMGITLLLFAPIPYVDASAAWLFQDKHKRMLVGAAGMLVEMFIASVALFIWLMVEPGLIRDMAFNAMLVGSITTLLFNGNPLLRFDGYYILQDWAEIPNLYTRSGRYYLYLIRRYFFGVSDEAPPVTAEGETPWLLVYGLGAFFYRLFILVFIILFLAEEYLFIGVALAVWAVVMQVIMPLVRGIRFISGNPTMEDYRKRAATVCGSVVVVASLLLLMMPVSLTTNVEGVVWVADQAQLYTGAEGFVDKVLVKSGQRVEVGSPVIQMRAPELTADIARLDALRRELRVRGDAEYFKFKVKSKITAEEIITVEAELALQKEREAALLITSQAEGVLVLPDEWQLQGSFLKQGKLVGYVVNPDRQIITAVVAQSDIGLVRQQIVGVEVRLSERLGQSIPVSISRSTPAGSKILPSRVLGVAGGGAIAVQKDEDGVTAIEKVFKVELALPANNQTSGVGERAYVRFDHGSEPLAQQWFRSIRQLLLSRLSF